MAGRRSGSSSRSRRGELIDDHARFAAAMDEARLFGVRVAIDDFGAGYAGLTLLAEFQPDEVKIDMQLVRSIESHGPRQAIVRAVAQPASTSAST